MSIGNPNSGLCPVCKGLMQPAEWCPHEEIECEPEFCPVGDECHEANPAIKCSKCGFTTKEVD